MGKDLDGRLLFHSLFSSEFYFIFLFSATLYKVKLELCNVRCSRGLINKCYKCKLQEIKFYGHRPWWEIGMGLDDILQNFCENVTCSLIFAKNDKFLAIGTNVKNILEHVTYTIDD